MLKRPQWVKEKIEGREKEVPLQMTVKKKYSLQAPYASMPTVSMYTGSGVDGKVQPGKMVDIQVHEGEGIIPNNAMQGLTGEEFKGLVETLSSGRINKNKLREAINMPTVTEYQTGGKVQYSGLPTTDEIPDYSANTMDSRSRGVPNDRAVDTMPDYTNRDPGNRRSFGTSGYEGQTTNKETLPPVTAPTRKTIQPPVTPPATTIAPQTTTPQTVQTETVTRETPTYDFKPPPPITQPEITVPEVVADQTKETKVETPPETVTKPVVSPAGEMVRQGLQKILAETQGISDVDRKIANFYLQNTDASNAANLRILESQISADPNMSDQAKRAAIAGLQREAQANRSELTGKLAINAAERASKASRDLVTYGGEVRTFEEVTLPESRQNLEIQKRTFDEITKPMSELEIEQLKSEIGDEIWDNVQNMIDKNMGIDRINDYLAEKNIRPISTEEYAKMMEAGSLGERNWGRNLAAAELALSVGNWESAALMYSNLYEGVDFDFSKLATKEAAANFSQGLTQMSSYAAANWSLEDAMAAMEQDRTMELMGIEDKETLARMYNATNINVLDAEWERIETSKMYQDLLNSDNPQDQEDARNIKLFSVRAELGLLDFDTVHEYVITGPNGERKGSVFQTSPEEAQKEADKYGPGYTIEDNGNVDFIIKSEPTTQVEGATVADSWKKFEETIPEDEPVTQDLYKRWLSWQKDNPDGTYDDFINTEKLSNKLQTITVGTNKELLNTENSNILMESYKENPDAVKEKGFYFNPPKFSELKAGISTETGGLLGTGKTKTSVSSYLKESLDDSVGQMTEIPMSSGTVVGQIERILYNPHSVQMRIKKLNGDIQTVTIYDSDHGSYRPQPKYYGSTKE
jgi:hypothetical protein